MIILIWIRMIYHGIVRLWFPTHSVPDIYSVLRDSDYRTTYYVNNEKRNLPFTEDEYTLSPNIRKTHWLRLGNKLTANEHCLRNVPDHCYYSIRLDGKNFSSVLPQLIQSGGFSDDAEPYSHLFDDMMKALAKYLMVKCNAVYAYVQSDEVTLLMSPMMDRKTRQFVPHYYNGRHDKLTTLVAGLAARFLCLYVTERQLHTKIPFHPPSPRSILSYFPKLEMIMDARLGIYESHADAFELILWRAYDCSVNAISTALYLNQVGGSLEFMSTAHRLVLLKQCGIMSTMTEHQKYGTLLHREKTSKDKEGDSKEGDSKEGTRKEGDKGKYTIVDIPGNVIVQTKRGNIRGIW